MNSEKTQRVAYMKGFDAGYRKFEAEFETLLEVSEGRLREIEKLKKEIEQVKSYIELSKTSTKDWNYHAEYILQILNKKKPHSRIDIVGQNGNDGEHYE